MTADAPDPRLRRGRWLLGFALLCWVLQLSLIGGAFLRPGGEVGPILWYLAMGTFSPLAGVTLLAALVWAGIRRPFVTRRRIAAFVLLALLWASAFPVQFLSYPSSHDDYVSEVRFRLPLDGPVTVAWGGASVFVNYHAAYPDQRWAYDLLVRRDGERYSGTGDRLEDYYCYGLEIVAPADGRVVLARDGEKEWPPNVLSGQEPAGGNQITLEVADGEFLCVCHLQPGSLRVQEGDQVTRGQVLGLVGNSGNTSEPHLHIHLQDKLEDDVAEGIPLYFHDYRQDGQVVERGIPPGGFMRGAPATIVEHAAAE